MLVFRRVPDETLPSRGCPLTTMTPLGYTVPQSWLRRGQRPFA
jgi:hypothetical protein